ncbi:MAG: InlB B-repeat-containing protein, partial [Clostridia bacterium]|nr:InlB B-repeat-containing protein [Clostridia bacterium]
MKKFLSVLLLAVMCVCGALGLTACDLEKQPINVVFIVNDSTYSATKMYDPATVKAPSDPVLTGYAFDGWFLDKDVWEQPYDATAVISESVNVYAKLHTVHVHDIKTQVIAPTCTEKGYTRHYCDCGEIDYNDRITYALGHNFGNWEITTAPTCTEKGEETRTCSRCGEKETRDLEALGHSFGNWEITTAPTCTENGEETRTCSRCQEVEKRDIQETGHSPMKAVKENEVPATCTEKGSYDLVVYCSVCNEELSREGQEIEALGHNYGDLVAEKPVKACTESGETDGFKAHYKCSTCGAYFDTDKNPVDEKDLVIATEHDYKVTTVLPKCTEQGYDVHECQDCHKIIKDNFVDALGHDFEGAVYVSDDNATFESNGTKTAHCKRDKCAGTDKIEEEGSKLKIKLATLDLKIDSNATDKYLATGVVNSDVLAFGLNAEIVNKDEDVTFKVCTANDAEKEIDGDSVALDIGDNTYYILIYVNEELDSYYKVVIHRNKLITVTFDANGGSWGDKTLI